MNSLPMIFRFCSGSVTPCELREEALRGVDVLELDVKILAEDALHHLFFARAEETVVDEDAGELIADRLVQKRGDDRGIDAAAQAEHHLLRRPPAARTRSQASSMNEPIVQSIAQWQM